MIEKRVKPRLLIVTELYPNQFQSHLGIFVREQLLELRDSFDITVLTTIEASYLQQPRLQHPHSINDESIEVHYLRYYPWWLWLLQGLRLITRQEVILRNKKYVAKRFLALAEKLHRRNAFSLVHGHETYLGDEAGPIGELLNIPSVFTLHGWRSEHEKTFGEETVRLAIENIKKISLLIADSKKAAASYLEALQRPFRVIANGAHLVASAPLPDAVGSFCLSDNILVSVGSLSASKRFNISIDCLAYARQHGHPQAKLIIVGKGEEHERLVQQVQEKKLSHAVLFLSNISRSDLSAIIERATIFLHPSKVDAFSLVCVEGMLAGKPVVADAGIGIIEFTTPDQDIVAIPSDHPEYFLTAVLELLDDPEKQLAIGQAAAVTAKKFTWPAIAKELLTLYQELIQTGPGNFSNRS